MHLKLQASAIKLFLFFLVFPLWAHATHCYFIPPKGWEFADPSHLSPRVQVGFVMVNKNNSFNPSLNLAIEEKVEVGMEEYLKCIKARHEKEHKNRWRDLGSFATPAGTARLTSLDTKTEGGEARLLQLILIKDKQAYILTAAASKEDFGQHHQEFEKAFRSLQLTDDLLKNLGDSAKQACLQARDILLTKWKAGLKEANSAETHFADEKFQKEAWLPFQKCVLSQGSVWGPYGQLLFLRDAQKELIILFDRSRG